ncbi:MAG: lysophospholipid acyltransferase family protein [Nanoarchaeota archaeon]
MVYPIFKRTILPFWKLFLKEIVGVENIPEKGPFIITSNYASYLDPWLIGSIIIPLKDKKMHYLSMKGRFWDLWGDRIMKDWLGIVLLEGRKKEALQDLLSLLKKGEIVGIFIEGDRSPDGNLQKGKTGVIRLALKSHVPVLPIGIIGTFDIAPRNQLIPKLKRAKMRIGKPIYLDEYYKRKIDKKLLRKLTDSVMHVISDLTGKPYNH